MSVTWTPQGEWTDIRYELSRGRDREDHDRPAGGAQRVPAADDRRDLAGVRAAREDTTSASSSSPARAPLAFCSGGDQRVRGDTGYVARGAPSVGRFHVTDLHVQIRRLPKPVVAMVAGYAVGGGHVLHLVCDLTIAADNARFGQTGPRVGSFDGGFGAGAPGRRRRAEEGEGDLVPRRQYDARSRRWRWGSSTPSSRSSGSRQETVAWCREMLASCRRSRCAC